MRLLPFVYSPDIRLFMAFEPDKNLGICLAVNYADAWAAMVPVF
jgi:hypothetical protein